MTDEIHSPILDNLGSNMSNWFGEWTGVNENAGRSVTQPFKEYVRGERAWGGCHHCVGDRESGKKRGQNSGE